MTARHVPQASLPARSRQSSSRREACGTPRSVPRTRRGFTLVELIVALTIAGLLTSTVVTAVATLTRAQQGIERRVERSGAARRALGEIAAALRNVRNDPTPRFPVVVGQRGRQRSGDRIDLLAVSDRTARPGMPESDQYEISFYLKQRRRQRWPSLMRRQDPALDEHPERGGVETLVAEGIVELRFAYYSRQEWHDDWSEPESPPPEAVRVTVTAVERDSPDDGRRPAVTTLSTIVAIRKPRAQPRDSNRVNPGAQAR